MRKRFSQKIVGVTQAKTSPKLYANATEIFQFPETRWIFFLRLSLPTNHPERGDRVKCSSNRITFCAVMGFYHFKQINFLQR